MTGSHKELKYNANIKEVFIPSLRTAKTLKQKHITLSIVKF